MNPADRHDPIVPVVYKGPKHLLSEIRHLHLADPTDPPSVLDLSVWQLLALALPRRGQSWTLKWWKLRNFVNVWRGWRRVALARALGIPHHFGVLWLRVIRGDGTIEDYGLASLRVITDVGCQKIVAAMNTSDAATFPAFKYHALGTGTNAEAASDTALQTELTTEYTGNVRATGSQTTGATTKVYRSVGTNTLDSGTPAITEHGLMSQAATGGGSLFDRSVFAAINLVGANGDGLTSTYDAVYASGG